MKAISFLASTLLCAALGAGPAPAAEAAHAPTVATSDLLDKVWRDWFAAEWRVYALRFVSEDGRVVDNANGGVSHSEGQGYGLLLAFYARDAVAFDRIWSWTRTHLQSRADRLLAWRWDPKTGVASDMNNASDGDILVSWALARAGVAFHRPDYLAAARDIAHALGDHALVSGEFGPLLLPGARGFTASEQPDGPVVNPSYWVFPAFATLAELDPAHDWRAVQQSGLALLADSRFGPRALPSDWESARDGALAPAKNFAADFGYNAIRIPLYLAWSAEPGMQRDLRRFDALWRLDRAAPTIIRVDTGGAGSTLADAGYRLIGALARCAVSGAPVDADLIRRRDALYYPETLRLLSVAVLQERYPQCI